MKLKFTFSIIVFLFSFSIISFAQKESFKCGHTEMQQKLWELHPEMKLEYEKILLESKSNYTYSKKRNKFIIPIVFHIIHQNGDENISDQQIKDQVRILNLDFLKLNPDTANIDPAYNDIIANCNFEFRLATIDNLGKKTNGIDRIYSHLTNNGSDASKLNQWDRSKYLNVWVVKTIGKEGVAGYAYFPAGVNGYNYAFDGIIIKHEYIGSIGTSSPSSSRALTHEIGHYLGLHHTWGDGNNPGVACGDDFVDDTPTTKGYTVSGTPFTAKVNNPQTCSESITYTMLLDSVKLNSGNTDKTPISTTSVNFKLNSLKAENLTPNSLMSKIFAFGNWPIGGINGDTTSQNNNGVIDTTKYYEIGFSPKQMNMLNLESMSFLLSRNNSGIKNISIRNNKDKYSSSIPFTFTSAPTAIINTNFSYDTVKCINSSNPKPIKATEFTNGGYFKSSTVKFIDTLSGEVDITKISNGTYSISYIIPATSLSSKTTKTIKLIVDFQASASLTYAKSIACNSGYNHPTVNIQGGSFFGSSDLSLDVNSGTINLNNSKPGTYNITYTAKGGNCDNTSSVFELRITDKNNSNIAHKDDTICKGNSTYLPKPKNTENFAKGGKYIAAKTGVIINSATGEINLTTSSVGKHDIYYTIDATDCSNKKIDTFSILIKAAIARTFSYPKFINCIQTGTSANLNDTLKPITSFKSKDSYTFSAPSGLVFTDITKGYIDLKNSIDSVYTLTLIVKDSNRCEVNLKTDVQIISESQKPITKFSYAADLCGNKTGVLPVLESKFVKSGTFSASNKMIINQITGELDLKKYNFDTVYGEKKFAVYYTVNTECNTIKTSKDTTYLTITSPTSISLSNSIFANKDSISLKVIGYGTSKNQLFGTFTSNPSLTIDNKGNIKLYKANPGTYTVNYVLPEAKKCTNTNIPITLTVIQPSVINLKNDIRFVSDEANTINVNLTLDSKKYSDLRKKDSLIFRIYGWNAEDVIGFLGLDSLKIKIKSSSIDNIENYMEYAYQSKMFTKGQQNRMTNSLLSSISNRNNLWKDENLIETGTKDEDTSTKAPKVAFTSVINKGDFSNMSKMICIGQSIKFIDQSWEPTNSSVERTWIFEDGVPSSSNENNPIVTYSTTGKKKATLIIKNSKGTDSLTINDVVTVYDNSGSTVGPIEFDFEGATPENWVVQNELSNYAKFSIVNNTSYNKGSNCYKLNNYKSLIDVKPYEEDYFYYERLNGAKDALTTNQMDLSTSSNVTLSFDYSFASDAFDELRMTDKLNVYSSKNCGEDWTLLKTIGSSKNISADKYAPVKGTDYTLITAGNFNGIDFKPSVLNQWKSISIPLTIGKTDTKTRFKLEFTASSTSNNLYIDNLNINGVLGINESPLTAMDISIYPNPSNGNQKITVSYTANNEPVTISLLDLDGKLISSNTNSTTNGMVQHSIDLNQSLTNGCYFVTISQGKFSTTRKLIIL